MTAPSESWILDKEWEGPDLQKDHSYYYSAVSHNAVTAHNSDFHDGVDPTDPALAFTDPYRIADGAINGGNTGLEFTFQILEW